ncbi:Rhodanese-like domain-containing protein 4, chloroplastic [Ananas comosus]|uniref:Protein THYLAKOID RHODANESE-LIKE, chloroplastic n=1 Tax=Ananas comosus TaxID=4615 RepID=A0A199V272_ANACO|nr:Rhodanese-like domain-containing protein 4, chloroplastic [Ananas comosus]
MEVLNAAGLTPIALQRSTFASEKRAEPKKLLPFRFKKPFLKGGLASLSSILLGSSGFAHALTYEEALGQSMSPESSPGDSIGFDLGQFLDAVVKFASENQVDLGQFLDAVVKFASENPLIVGGGTAAVAVPLLLFQILQKPKPWGVDSAKGAYAKLSQDPDAQLLDIREGRDFKEVGSPDVKGLKKKAVSIMYRGGDKLGFLKKLSSKFKDPANTTLFILDKFDGNSEFVAELVTANGFKAAFAIKDGAEGPRGWIKSGLPWTPPNKALIVDFGDLNDAISTALGESSDGLPVTLGLAAATGLGLFAFTEVETLLQLLGSAAIIQLVTKKFLFAEDRKVTLRQIDEFLNTKVAPKELVGEIKMIGKALLPAPTSARSLPAPALGSSSASTDSTAEAAPETKAVVKEEAAAEPPPQVNSVSVAEASKESVPAKPRPLSPYPYVNL